MTEMSPGEAVYFAAVALPPADRAAYLARACAGRDGLRRRVEQMLAGRDQVGDFLEPLGGAPAVATADFPGGEETIGAVLAGKYKLVEQIGEGGMGSVYVAQQREPVRRAVAVKVIKAGMDSKAVLGRFEAERQALAMMDHPNIARVLDAGTTASGRPFFVMELVKGIPITQYCDQQKLTPRQRLELFVPVCHAIQHAHQKGVIHRDIKPSNVLVALYDDRPVPTVIDFGVAKAAGQALTDQTLMTGFGAVIGTPEYMSPEQASLNNLDIDTRSDVYSLGVLLYELLTGSTPVDRRSLGQAALLEVLRIVRDVEVPRPSMRLSTTDALPRVAANRGTEPAKLSKLMKGELDWILLKALEKDRARRYETANGIAADVQRYLANEPIVARPPSTAYRIQKTWQRNRLAFAAGGAVAASLVIGIGVSISQAVRADREASRSMAALDELRATAPAFAEQARGLAAREKFDEAIEKLDYAAKLRADEPNYLIAKADLLQCQFRFADAAAVYRAVATLRPDDPRATAGADLCDELLAAPRGPDGRLTREGLSKLHLAMQRQQRPAAELMPAARLLGEEKAHVVALWLDRLKGLPVSADKPLAQRLKVRDDGLLSLDLSDTKVADLAPLAGAPLAVLNLSHATEVKGIEPLRGMRLVDLDLSATKVADLAPLAGMTTLGRLVLNETLVGGLDPVRGLPLKNLSLDHCPVSDLSPLRGAPLERLDLRDTRVTDLAPVASMPLKVIDLTRTPVLDFTPLAGLPLQELHLQHNRVTDLGFVRGMPLRELSLWGCVDARNYEALTELNSLELLLLPRNYRDLPEKEFASLAKLRNHSKLRQLGAEITDRMPFGATGPKEKFWKDWDEYETRFGPLRRAGLTFNYSQQEDGSYELKIENQPTLTDLTVLASLKDLPLQALWLNGCGVSDLTPLRALPLRILGLTWRCSGTSRRWNS
jgi:serine/threonine protein kinase/Leucine-rich repeat (LRR) protein